MKKPLVADLSSISRGFGIEVEMALPSHAQRQHVQQTLASILSSNGLPAISRTYSNSPVPTSIVLVVEYDSSIGAPPVVVEGRRINNVSFAQIEIKTTIIRSPEEFERILPLAIGICQALGAKASGGFHVHVGVDEMRDDPSRIRSIYNLCHRFENILFGLQPPSRSSTQYARALPDRPRLLHGCRSLKSYQRALRHLNRHYGINFTHLWGPHPHLEFRHAASSLNGQKIKGWTYLCLQLVEHAMKRKCQASPCKVAKNRNGLEKMIVTCGFKGTTGIYETVKDPRIISTRKWMIKRWRELNDNS